jgi:uncharacterized secreted protein with C-terminal beta-propeller domain
MTRIARPLILALLALALLAATADARRQTTRLRAFDSCGQLVRYGVSHATRILRSPAPMPVVGGAPGAADGPVTGEAAPGNDAAGRAEGEGTNVQEAGVDEPDTLKTDGKTLFTVAAGRLEAVDVTGAEPRRLDSLKLPGYSQQLLLHGARLLVMGGADAGGTLLLEIDVSDPARLRVARSLAVDGSVLSSRMHDGTARVVIGSTPLALVDTPVAIARTGSTVPRVSRKTARWLPRGRFHSRISGRKWTRALVPCRSVRRPTTFSGLETLTVMTIDLDKGLWATDRDAILASAETVYASTGSLYVATQRWTPAAGPAGNTAIHRFDASTPTTTSYVGSGEVPGHLLNQFSLSEHGGVLRAATTAGDQSESRVTTLELRGGRLDELGHVGGLGKGERIYAVRFIGSMGYVVTFRQVDPLYTVDLSDPKHPAVRGELKINGYSAYLHPVGEGLLLGVGQDADANGRTRGVQVSLFDVSDAANPVRLAQRSLGRTTNTPVEYDHHAFLWWPDGQLAVFPLVDEFAAPEFFSGAVGLRLAPGSIGEAGRVAHPSTPDRDSMIQRSIVAAGSLWTVSDAGAARSSLDTLARTAWVPFG